MNCTFFICIHCFVCRMSVPLSIDSHHLHHIMSVWHQISSSVWHVIVGNVGDRIVYWWRTAMCTLQRKIIYQTNWFKIKFLISIVTLIARHPCIKPTALFMLHCNQVPVFHSPDYVTLNKIFFSKRIFTDHANLIVKTSFKTRGHYNRPWQSSKECWNKRTHEKNVPNRSKYYLNLKLF